MPCCSCISKLAYKLIEHHRTRLDAYIAFELAEKAMERVEKRQSQEATINNVTVNGVSGVKPQPLLSGDYSQNCIASGTCHCNIGAECGTADDCRISDSCTCSCPSPSKAHSHYANDTCRVGTDTMTGCLCNKPFFLCGGTCTCGCGGFCYYNCDTGYTWNGSDCIPIPVVAGVLGDGIVFVGS